MPTLAIHPANTNVMSVRLWPNKAIQTLLLFACFAAYIRLAVTRPLVDTVLPLSEIIWRPEGSTEFVGSPSIIRLTNGTYLASHDDFGPGGVSEKYLTH